MTNIKRLTAVVALTFALSMTAFAGDNPPVCNPDPGIMQSPPCAATQLVSDESAPQKDAQTTLAEESAISLTEATVDVLQSLLTLL
jgi:hypothetical protein